MITEQERVEKVIADLRISQDVAEKLREIRFPTQSSQNQLCEACRLKAAANERAIQMRISRLANELRAYIRRDGVEFLSNEKTLVDKTVFELDVLLKDSGVYR